MGASGRVGFGVGGSGLIEYGNQLLPMIENPDYIAE